MTRVLAPVVVIDLSDQTAPQAVERVVRTCSEAIAFGECVAEGTELSEPPLAVAIVRVGEGPGDLIRIEMGRRDQPASWRVRELHFHPSDPEPERWRAVGLAIATLFGEAMPEAAPGSDAAGGTNDVAPSPPLAEQPSVAPGVAESASAVGAGAGGSEPSVVRPSAETTSNGTRAAREPVLEDSVVESPAPRHVAPQPATGAFIGLGILAGPALNGFGLRWGGSARAGWVASQGWLVALSGSYSQHRQAEERTVSWLHLAATAGRRFELGPVWGAALSGGGGAREIGLQAEVGGTSARSQRWNPFVTVSAELWRHLGGGLAGWAALDFDALAAESRLFVGGTQSYVVPPIDAVGLLGLRWVP
jgi:hypothetical protein